MELTIKAYIRVQMYTPNATTNHHLITPWAPYNSNAADVLSPAPKAAFFAALTEPGCDSPCCFSDRMVLWLLLLH